MDNNLQSPPTQEQLNKVLFWKRFAVMTNILLFVWGIIVIAYVCYKVVPNIEEFKTLNKDVCALCMEKTGAVCTRQTFPSNIKAESDYPSFNNFSLSSFSD